MVKFKLSECEFRDIQNYARKLVITPDFLTNQYCAYEYAADYESGIGVVELGANTDQYPFLYINHRPATINLDGIDINPCRTIEVTARGLKKRKKELIVDDSRTSNVAADFVIAETLESVISNKDLVYQPPPVGQNVVSAKYNTDYQRFINFSLDDVYRILGSLGSANLVSSGNYAYFGQL